MSLHDFPLPAGPIPLEPIDQNEQLEDGDIYRGAPPPHKRSYASSTSSVSSSGSSSSSSSPSFLGRGRLGAIAAVVEQAISRWARRNALSTSSSSSSTSTSTLSSSSSSSTSSTGHIHPRRLHRTLRPKRTSISTMSLRSERDFAAAMKRIKAREESRQIPRGFMLYLPPLPTPHDRRGGPQRVIRTTSLFTVLGQLGAALTRSAKLRRNDGRPRTHRIRLKEMKVPVLSTTIKDAHEDGPIIEHPAGRTSKKGKHKAGHQDTTTHAAPDVYTIGSESFQSKAWYLNVASPTWDDMREIGRLLHLHPLTLEDILQREPREKLEVFPKLGYYFISFRAIDSQAQQEARPGSRQAEGPVGESNIYVVVFQEGVCTFHYTNMSEHTDRICNRIVRLEETTNTSANWMAHGILDSIVDSFFPYLEEIEKEVMAIEALVFSRDLPELFAETLETVIPASNSTMSATDDGTLTGSEKEQGAETEIAVSFDEKSTQPSSTPRTRFSVSWRPFNLRRLKRLANIFSRHFLTPSATTMNPTTTTLRRMARARRLVVSLARLLATKADVIAQVRKRLTTSTLSGSASANRREALEVAMYMGDIEDHIFSLQHSLLHYERMFSQSHPTYLSQLRTTVALARSGTDKALIVLTIVSIAVLCIQTLIGTFSMNINVPSNSPESNVPYNVFGIVIALAGVILCLFLGLVHHWWMQAKRQRRARALL